MYFDQIQPIYMTEHSFIKDERIRVAASLPVT
jgi:hypothetical protein